MEVVVQRNGKKAMKVLVIPCITGLVILSVLVAKGFGVVKGQCRKLKVGGNKE